jgi:glycosyltransferase involved in cell wall biosynthesis
MKKKHIFIWQSGEPLHIDKNNHSPMRAINLSNFLLENNFKVTLISSNFDHTYKKFRIKNIKKFKILRIKKNFNLVLINSIGYKKNISLKRLIDHFHLALNLNFFLKNNKKNPDIAFIGFPPIEPAIIFSSWLLKNKIPYLFDIKDLWPEYFYERFKNKFIANIFKLIFSVHDIILRNYLKKSSAILASNNFFLKYTLKKIERKKKYYDRIFYLTKPILNYNSNSFLKHINFKKKVFNLYFCGRVDLKVFDFITVFRALSILNTKDFKFHFYIAGYGDLETLSKLRTEYQLKKNVTLIGYINKYNHSLLLRKMNLFIAPFFNNLNFSSNLSNKFIESIQYNIPILTPLQKEVAAFILKNKIGLVYKENNCQDLVNKIIILKKKINKNKLIQNKLINLSTTLFNHERNYSKILEILNIIHSNDKPNEK